MKVRRQSKPFLFLSNVCRNDWSDWPTCQRVALNEVAVHLVFFLFITESKN